MKDSIMLSVLFVVAAIAFVVILFAAIFGTRPDTAQGVAENRIRRVVVDGQECMVLSQKGGKLIALDCDWSGR